VGSLLTDGSEGRYAARAAHANRQAYDRLHAILRYPARPSMKKFLVSRLPGLATRIEGVRGLGLYDFAKMRRRSRRACWRHR
jgi:hypothetical protein